MSKSEDIFGKLGFGWTSQGQRSAWRLGLGFKVGVRIACFLLLLFFLCVCVSVCALLRLCHRPHIKMQKKKTLPSIHKCGCLTIRKQKWKCPIPPQVKEIPIGQTSDHSAWRGVKSAVLICSVCDESTIRATAGHRGVCPLFDWACPLWATVCGWNIKRRVRWGPGVHVAAAAETSSSFSYRKEEKPVNISDDMMRCQRSATGPDSTWSYSLDVSETIFVSKML